MEDIHIAILTEDLTPTGLQSSLWRTRIEALALAPSPRLKTFHDRCRSSMRDARTGHGVHILTVRRRARPLMALRARVDVYRCGVLRSQRADDDFVNFRFRIRTLGHYFILRHRPPLPPAPIRTLRSIRGPGRMPAHRNWGIVSTLRLLPAEPPEASFLLRVHQVDCLHRQFGEGVRSPDRAS